VVLRDGAERQHLLELDLPRLTIGRGPSNDIALTWDDRASRLHAELEFLGGEWVIVDDGLSTNGTWVGEERVVGRRRLYDGDVIRVGDTLIAFCAPGSQNARTNLAENAGSAVQITPGQRRVLVALCRPVVSDGAGGVPLSNRQVAEELCVSVDGQDADQGADRLLRDRRCTGEPEALHAGRSGDSTRDRHRTRPGLSVPDCAGRGG
jgi:hypothetical protein